jgi:pimeloyl-ACP methyl ester carboxylesterase
VSASADTVDGGTTRRIDLGSVTLEVDLLGEGPPILFLHGFPEGRRAFAPVAHRLTDSYRAILPDQRGYGGSSRPTDEGAYAIENLVEDAARLIDALGYDRVTVVGHDWGGIVAIALASHHPERVERLILANAPHPSALRAALIEDRAQALASDYLARLRGPDPEQELLSDGPASAWDRIFAGTPIDPATRQAMIAEWSVPGTVNTMCRWYRDNPYLTAPAHQISPPWNEGGLRVTVPTLLLWGMQDRALQPGLIGRSAAYFDRIDIVRMYDAGHDIIHPQADKVARHIREFLA